MNNKKVCVVGLGGVGGYLGCMLAHNYDNIFYFARGERLASIKKNGLKLYSDAFGEFTTYQYKKFYFNQVQMYSQLFGVFVFFISSQLPFKPSSFTDNSKWHLAIPISFFCIS